MRSTLASLSLAVLSLCTPLRAAVVQLDLTVDMVEHSWQVFAEVQNGSAGLDGFSLDVVGTGGLAVVSSLNQSPTGFDATLPWGFFDFRSDGTAGVALMAAQNSVYGPVNDPAKDALVLQDVGERPVNGTVGAEAGGMEDAGNAGSRCGAE